MVECVSQIDGVIKKSNAAKQYSLRRNALSNSSWNLFCLCMRNSCKQPWVSRDALRVLIAV